MQYQTKTVNLGYGKLPIPKSKACCIDFVARTFDLGLAQFINFNNLTQVPQVQYFIINQNVMVAARNLSNLNSRNVC